MTCILEISTNVFEIGLARVLLRKVRPYRVCCPFWGGMHSLMIVASWKFSVLSLLNNLFDDVDDDDMI